MTKGKHGNKEAKKPKKTTPPPAPPSSPAEAVPSVAPRPRKR